VGRLTARFAATATPGDYLDGSGLYLCVAPSLSRSWVYRFSWHGRRPEMGLGRFPDVSLAEARALRDEASRALRSGRNPIEETDSGADQGVRRPHARGRPQPRRRQMAMHFGLLYAGSILAIESGVLPWTRAHAQKALTRAFRDAVEASKPVDPLAMGLKILEAQSTSSPKSIDSPA
jgi:hypothetical protein